MSVLEIRDVGVDFPTIRVPSLKEWAIRRLRRDFRQDYFHALSDVTISVERGRCLGIIGRNGAGKSTLLRVAAGVITPTKGAAIIRGTVAPLIELGTGFDAELTGRENIFFNAALLGRSRAQVRARLDEIIDFSGLEAFIDAPLRTYSTGMVARLAFSIATTVDAELILLDEILAVGDAAFQQRCEERILSFFRSGCTIVLVSHDLGSVRRLCTDVVWLHDGRIRASGSDDAVIDAYESEAVPHAVSLPLREGEAAPSSPGRMAAPATPPHGRRLSPQALKDVAIVHPAAADGRIASTLLEQRLRELYDARLIAAQELPATVPEPFVFVITDPRLVPSRPVIDKLRRVLEQDATLFASVPVTNLSTVPEQCANLGRAYWTQRQFDDGTEWLSRKEESSVAITWGEADPGAFLIRAADSGAVKAGTPLHRALAGRRVAVERTAYVHRFPPFSRLPRPDLVERIAPDAATVLQVFCGEGIVGAALKSSRSCRVVGIEPDTTAVATARQRLDEVREGSPLGALPSIDELFDAIVIDERFTEEAEPIELLRALRRLCRPGGSLLLSVPNIGAWTVVSDLLLGRFDYGYISNPLAASVRAFTEKSLEQVLLMAGWDVTGVELQPQGQTAESRRLLDALDAGSVPHAREQLLAGSFYVTATPRS